MNDRYVLAAGVLLGVLICICLDGWLRPEQTIDLSPSAVAARAATAPNCLSAASEGSIRGAGAPCEAHCYEEVADPWQPRREISCASDEARGVAISDWATRGSGIPQRP